MSTIEWTTLGLLVVVLGLTAWSVLRRPDDRAQRELTERLQEALRADARALERGLRDEVGRSAADTRQELGQTLATFQQTLLHQQGDMPGQP